MAVEPLLVLGGEVALLVDVRSVLDRGLVVAHGHVAVAADLGPGERHEVLAGAQETGVDGDPLGLVGVVVVVDVADLADLVAVAVVGGGADDVAQLVLGDHQCAPLRGDGLDEQVEKRSAGVGRPTVGGVGAAAVAVQRQLVGAGRRRHLGPGPQVGCGPAAVGLGRGLGPRGLLLGPAGPSRNADPMSSSTS